MIFCDGACPCCLLCLREGFLFLVCELVSDFTLTAECLLQQIPTKSKRQSLSQTHTHITHTLTWEIVGETSQIGLCSPRTKNAANRLGWHLASQTVLVGVMMCAVASCCTPWLLLRTHLL